MSDDGSDISSSTTSDTRSDISSDTSLDSGNEGNSDIRLDTSDDGTDLNASMDTHTDTGANLISDSDTEADVPSDMNAGTDADNSSDEHMDEAMPEASGDDLNSDSDIDTQPVDTAMEAQQNTEPPTYTERFRGSLKDAQHAMATKATELGDTSISSHEDAVIRLGKIGLSATKPLGSSIVYGTAATMEAATRQYGNPAGDLNTMQIQQHMADDVQGLGRTDPMEPFQDNQPIVDADTGEELTSEKFRD